MQTNNPILIMKIHKKIYLSGADGAGKTTLARFFQGHGYEIVKWSKPKPNEDFVTKAIDQIAMPKRIVFDRGWCGDIIYAPIFGTQPVIQMGEAVELLRIFIKGGGTLIYVKADRDKLIARIEERGDDYVDAGMIEDIVQGYELFFQELKNVHRVPFLTLDTTNLF